MLQSSIVELIPVTLRRTRTHEKNVSVLVKIHTIVMIKVNNKLIFESRFTLSRTRPSIYFTKNRMKLPSLQIVLQNYILRLSSTCQKLYQQKIVKVKEYILTKATHNIHIFVLFKRLCAIIFQGHVLNWDIGVEQQIQPLRRKKYRWFNIRFRLEMI